MTRTAPAFLVLSLLLSACASADADNPDYQAGYGDGCTTANAASTPNAKPQRDDALYQTDPDYRSGWIAGHSDCRPGSAQVQ